MGRVPAARMVLATCQKENLGTDGNCWNGEIPNTQALASCFGAGRTVFVVGRGSRL